MNVIDNQTANMCPNCRDNDLVWDPVTGEIVCRKCGLVIVDAFLNTGPERAAFTKSEDASRRRVGSPPTYLMSDKGLPTAILQISRDSYGKKIPPDTWQQMYRLKKLQNRFGGAPNNERNLLRAFSTINTLTDRLHIPANTAERAAIIYRKALKKGIVSGRSIAGIATASLYAACRITHIPRTIEEFGELSTIGTQNIARCYRALLTELSLTMPLPEATLNIPRIASRVGITLDTQNKAVEILREAKRQKITAGKDPMGLAAAALYLACVRNGETRTQKTIAQASGVTAVTIRNRYKELDLISRAHEKNTYAVTLQSRR